MIKTLNILGARPNYMKVAPLQRLMLKDKAFRPVLVHTGQHYGDEMSDIFFRQLGIGRPDYLLGVGSKSHAQQTAEVMMKFEPVVEKERPDLVIVVGDVNSTLACSLVAVKMGVPVAHVEAGLRSYDWAMPEEHNRKLTDHISTFLFTSCRDGDKNLLKEGISKKKIHFVGNIMIDSLVLKMPDINKSAIRKKLKLNKGDYALMTLHRPSNVDARASLVGQLDIIEMIQDRIKLVFPMHPRTAKMIAHYKLNKRLARMKNLQVINPIGYIDFIKLTMDAQVVVTDSGGIQEETTVLKVPCITLRENTERPITIAEGTNVLAGTKLNNIRKEVGKVLEGKGKKGRVPKYWDGKTAGRILSIIKRAF